MKTFNQFIEATLPKTKQKKNKTVEIASHDKPLFKSVPATGVRGDQPANDLLIRSVRGLIKPSTPKNIYGI